ncbi:NUDIX domain-containing protein [Nonomuraea sp. NPDC050556]|uniref:NUDIX domain-containing protein n=1 Tax=Nonomuraea sp. NPDC050556 TaxID=3364369 RepID=UPI00378CBA08
MAAKDGDGWTVCERGHRHWGLYGAAGLLAVHHDDRGAPHVLMQKRSWWSHHGGTWGLPGGAKDSHEGAVATALREAWEEAALVPDGLRVQGVYTDDHGGWAFETVICEADALLPAAPANGESAELRWLSLAEIDRKNLHPGFAESWGEVRRELSPGTLVLDIANIVGARAERGWWNDRLGAATRLLGEVAGRGFDHPVLSEWFPRVVAVVEGQARGALAPDPVEVVDAEHSGDDAIVDVVRHARPWENVTVVTADRGLKERIAALGATTTGPRWLLAQL